MIKWYKYQPLTYYQPYFSIGISVLAMVYTIFIINSKIISMEWSKEYIFH